eukprot:COSAG05_NODE_910_length_6641_cov_27.153776_8_plen_72_part_00
MYACMYVYMRVYACMCVRVCVFDVVSDIKDFLIDVSHCCDVAHSYHRLLSRLHIFRKVNLALGQVPLLLDL